VRNLVMAKLQRVPSKHARNQRLQKILVMERGNNMPDTSDMCQEELDQWSDINNPNNDSDMDNWSDSHNPNNDSYIDDKD